MYLYVKIIRIDNRLQMNADKKPCFRGSILVKKQLLPEQSIGAAVELAGSLAADEFFPPITSSNSPPPNSYTNSGYLVTLCLHQPNCKGCFKTKWFNEDELIAARKLYDAIQIDTLSPLAPKKNNHNNNG